MLNGLSQVPVKSSLSNGAECSGRRKTGRSGRSRTCSPGFGDRWFAINRRSSAGSSAGNQRVDASARSGGKPLSDTEQTVSDEEFEVERELTFKVSVFPCERYACDTTCNTFASPCDQEHSSYSYLYDNCGAGIRCTQALLVPEPYVFSKFYSACRSSIMNRAARKTVPAVLHEARSLI